MKNLKNIKLFLSLVIMLNGSRSDAQNTSLPSFKSMSKLYPQDIFEAVRGSISPDGKQFVYGSFQTGDNALRLYLKDIKTGEIANLTKEASFCRNVCWSPDGQNILFVDIMEGKKGIWLCNIKSKQLTQILEVKTGNISGLQWRMDNTILFSSSLDERVKISSITPKGKIIENKLPSFPKNYSNLAMSPNGEYLAFYEAINENKTLNITDKNGLNKVKLTSELLILPELPIWSDDSKSISFSAAVNNDSCIHAWRVNVENGKLLRIDNVDGDVMRLSKMANGKVAFTTFNPQLSVGILPSNGGEPKDIFKPNSTDALMPAWSRDGKELIFMQGNWRMAQMIMTNNLKWDIYKKTIKDKSASRLTIAENGEDYGPCISPDGKWIAFHSHRNDTDDIYLTKNENYPQKIITISEGKIGSHYETGDPAWSADGSKIIFTGARDIEWGRPYIVEIDTLNGNPITKPRMVEIENFEGHVYSSRFSKDGKTITFCARMKDNSSGVFMMALNSKIAKNLVKYKSGETYGFAEWSKDEKWIYYASNDGMAQYRIYRVSVDGKKVEIISKGDSSALHPRVSPDGKKLAVTLYNADVQLWIEE